MPTRSSVAKSYQGLKDCILGSALQFVKRSIPKSNGGHDTICRILSTAEYQYTSEGLIPCDRHMRTEHAVRTLNHLTISVQSSGSAERHP